MKAVAITGSLGSGKTTALKVVHSLGFPAIDCDAIVAGLYRKKIVQKKLSKVFGTADKKKISLIAFSSPQKRKNLESLLHPLVWKELKAKLFSFKKQGKELVFIEVPLLFEAKWQHRFNAIIFVNASKQKCLQRLFKKGFSKKQALLRWQAQLSPEKKIKSSHYIINNNDSMAETRKQARELLAKLVNQDV